MKAGICPTGPIVLVSAYATDTPNAADFAVFPAVSLASTVEPDVRTQLSSHCQVTKSPFDFLIRTCFPPFAGPKSSAAKTR